MTEPVKQTQFQVKLCHKNREKKTKQLTTIKNEDLFGEKLA